VSGASYLTDGSSAGTTAVERLEHPLRESVRTATKSSLRIGGGVAVSVECEKRQVFGGESLFSGLLSHVVEELNHEIELLLEDLVVPLRLQALALLFVEALFELIDALREGLALRSLFVEHRFELIPHLPGELVLLLVVFAGGGGVGLPGFAAGGDQGGDTGDDGAAEKGVSRGE
jgi:hypothetical protein